MNISSKDRPTLSQFYVSEWEWEWVFREDRNVQTEWVNAVLTSLYLSDINTNYVLVPVDKTSNNVVFNKLIINGADMNSQYVNPNYNKTTMSNNVVICQF